MTQPEKKPLIVLFGRTNVGKSTLFNLLVEEKRALTADQAGTTRDANFGESEWRGRRMQIIDTGGIINLSEFTSAEKIRVAEDKKTIDRKVQVQARQLLSEADLIIFLLDTKAGLLPQDKELALFLKQHSKKTGIILAANKCDSPKENFRLPEFYKLGLGEPLPISAATGSGTGDLLDEIVDRLEEMKKFSPVSKAPEDQPDTEETAPIRVSIVGRPNAGKSSLINSILGRERVIVSPVPHTTREPQDTELEYEGRKIILVDTAGISKKASKSRRTDIPARNSKKINLEKEGIQLSYRSLNRSDVALLVLDISGELTREDARLADEIIGRKKSLIIIANKWDLILKKDVKKYTDHINLRLPFAQWAPIFFVSSLTGKKTGDILELISEIKKEREKILTQKELDKFLKKIVRIHRPSRSRASDRYPYIKKIRQSSANPPEMEVLIGAKESLDASYLRFIENRLRENFRFIGTPVAIRVSKGRFNSDRPAISQ